MKKSSVAVLASLATFTIGLPNALADTTQSQSLAAQSQQNQEVTTANALVGAQEAEQLNFSQSQSSAPGTTTQSVKGEVSAEQTTQVQINSTPQSVQQHQAVIVRTTQCQTGQSTPASLTQTTNPTTTMADPSQGISDLNAFAGFAVFDLQGNRLSDLSGLNVLPNVVAELQDVNNMTQHFVLFKPNSGTPLVIKAVNTSGIPIPSPVNEDLSIRSNNTFHYLSVDSSVVADVLIPAGSLGIPFEYIDTSETPSYDIPDVVKFDLSTVKPTMKTTQSEDVSSQSAVSASESQSTDQQGQHSVTSNGLRTTTQNSLIQTTQSQNIATVSTAVADQSQQVVVNTGPFQQQVPSTTAPTLPNINEQQLQTGKSAKSITATEAQSTTLTSTTWMTLNLTQRQEQTASSFLQSEGINAVASGGISTDAVPGTLVVYRNGQLFGSFTGVTGNVSAKESQTLDTIDASQTIETAVISIVQDGQQKYITIG